MGWCCDACMADGMTVSATLGGQEYHLCRRCYGKLILSLPKDATPADVQRKMQELTGEAQTSHPTKSVGGGKSYPSIRTHVQTFNKKGRRR